MTHHRADALLVDRRAEDGASFGELVSRLAHESKDLVALEVRRLRAEVREQTRRGAKIAATGFIAIELGALATLALGVAVFLVLGSWWDSYAAAAFATSGLLLLAAVACGLVVRAMSRAVSDAFEDEVRELKRDGRAIRGDH